MRTKLGTFRYGIDVLSADGERSEHVEPWVDVQVLYNEFPASMLKALGYRPDATRLFGFADGNIIKRPITDVRIRIGDQSFPMVCVFAEEGSEMLLGRLALSIFCLEPDQVNETLKETIPLMRNSPRRLA